MIPKNMKKDFLRLAVSFPRVKEVAIALPVGGDAWGQAERHSFTLGALGSQVSQGYDGKKRLPPSGVVSSLDMAYDEIFSGFYSIKPMARP
jgi:hypothetical protein